MEGQMDETLQVAKMIAEIGIDIVEAIGRYNEEVLQCHKYVNIVYVAPKKEEILGNIRYCGGI